MVEPEKKYVRIRLQEKDKANGFYVLMTNGNTYSDKKNEFVVEEKFLQKLIDSKIKFERLPQNDPL